nr:MAG TPA: hypothetical protein [Caudoviricetes sp.]
MQILYQIASKDKSRCRIGSLYRELLNLNSLKVAGEWVQNGVMHGSACYHYHRSLWQLYDLINY